MLEAGLESPRSRQELSLANGRTAHSGKKRFSKKGRPVDTGVDVAGTSACATTKGSGAGLGRGVRELGAVGVQDFAHFHQ